MIDLCYTPLLAGPCDHNFPWMEKSRARKWSKVIAMPALASNRKLANEVFALMYMKVQLCPEVLHDRDLLILRYWTDEVSVDWFIRPEGITYQVGAVGKLPSGERVLIQDLKTTIIFMSDYLDGKFDADLRDA